MRLLASILGLMIAGTSFAGLITERIYITPTANGKWQSANVVLTAPASGRLNVAGTVSASALQINGNILGGNAGTIFVSSNGTVGIGTTATLPKLTIVSAADTNVSNVSTYLGLGRNEEGLNKYRLIGFGYNPSGITDTKYPAYIGYQEKNNSGGTAGDLVFLTRPIPSGVEVTPSVVMRIETTGVVNVAGTVSASALVATALPAANETALYVSATGVISKATSSQRFKTNIKALDVDSSKVLLITPKSFNYKSYDVSGNMLIGQKNIGPIAEEVYQVLPELVNVDSKGDPYSLKDSQFIWLLLQEFKKLKQRIEALELK